MLRFDAVSKSFDDVVALASFSLDVAPGCTTVLIGPSGCGKSTILRLAIGLLTPDTGLLLFAGAKLSAENILQARRRIGYVIQEGGLFPHLSAYDNAALLARYLGQPSGQVAARVHALAELVHLPLELLQRYPLQMSGGQRQRVSLIRALMLDPDLLLLDEPLGSLDPMIRFDLQNDLKAVFSELGKTVLLVTHDMAEAGFFGDSIVLLRQGRIVQQGPVQALLEAPADPFVTRFINAQRLPAAALLENHP